MGLEAKNAAWDIERELEREEKPGVPASAARAELFANLGRRVADLSASLMALKGEPESVRLRDDLRRRLHALGIGARVTGFERLSAEVASAEALLEEVASRGALTPDDADTLRASFSKMLSLGFGAKERETEAIRPAKGAPISGRGPANDASPPSPETSTPVWPLSVLVVGPKPIADALVMPMAEGVVPIDVERTDDSLRAIDLARAVAPDVIVIDVDQPGSRELMSALRADPLSASSQIVALGTWSRPEEASAFLSLGAVRAVHKPASPEALRRVCRDASADRGDQETSALVGLVSLPELAERMGREMERAIKDGATSTEDGARVDLGRGDDLFGAILGAAARVRDVVTIRSKGEIRFAKGAAERVVPVGGWMNEPAPATSGASIRRGGVRPMPLTKKPLADVRVLVVDDDPAVAWFLAGVLRAEGALVSEACDGAVALRKAMSERPDVVLSDVLMPNVDGLSLTAALRADPLLADARVILLSWKEDLLQRARELGSRADAYMRKDASGPAVIERVRELLYPRARLAERIATFGETHGRVDGMTMCTLLRLVCTHRPECVLDIRDAAYLYELIIDGGRPVSVTRTAKDGSFVTGSQALGTLLGVRAARFVIAARSGDAVPEGSRLEGSLDEQLRPHAAMARAALRLLSGPSLALVSRVVLDEGWTAGYGAIAPEPVRSIVRRLTLGEAPRRIASASLSAARLLEEVVLDATSRGAVTKILGSQGEDLMPAIVASELSTLRGERPMPAPPPPEPAAEDSIPIDEVSPSGVIVAPAGIKGSPVGPLPGMLASDAAESLAAAGIFSSEPPDAESLSLSDAPPAKAGTPEKAAPSGARKEYGQSAPPEKVAQSASNAPLLTLGSLTPPPAVPRNQADVEAEPPVIKISARKAPVVIEEYDESPLPRRSRRREAQAENTPSTPGVKLGGHKMSIWVLCAVAGIVFAVGARISQERRSSAQPAPAQVVTAAPVAADSAAPAPTAAPAKPAVSVRVPGEAPDDPILPQEAPLRSDEKVPSGQGLLEVVAGPDDQISIDGQPTVAGPVVKATLAPRDKPYEVKVQTKSEERIRYARILPSKRTRVRLAPPWNH